MARRKKVEELPKGYFRKRGMIYVRRDPITRQRASTGYREIVHAREWYDARVRESLAPAAVAAHHVTVGRCCDEHEAAKRLSNLSASTLRFISDKLKPIRRICGEETPLDRIDTGSFDQYALKRGAEAGKRGQRVFGYTVKRELSEFLAALKRQKRAAKFAVDLETLMPDGLPSAARKVERNLTESEINALLRTLPTNLWIAFFATSIAIGLRKSETLKVAPEDIEAVTESILDGKGQPALDAEGNPLTVERLYVHVRGTKTEGADRVVPVLDAFNALLKSAMAYLPLRKIGNEWRTIGIACRKAQIEHCSPNDFRRSWATLCGSRGVSDEYLSKMLGHTTITMSRTVYNRAKASQLAPVVEGIMSKAQPIRFDLPDAVDETSTPGRRRKPPEGNPPKSSDSSCGGGGSEPDPEDGTPPAASGADWVAVHDCSPISPEFTPRFCSSENPGAPRKIRTCDLWLRRPNHSQANLAAKANAGGASWHERVPTGGDERQREPQIHPADELRTADADPRFGVESTGFSDPISRVQANLRPADSIDSIQFGIDAAAPEGLITSESLRMAEELDEVFPCLFQRGVPSWTQAPDGRWIEVGADASAEVLRYREELRRSLEQIHQDSVRCAKDARDATARAVADPAVYGSKGFGAADGQNTSSSTVQPEDNGRESTKSPTRASPAGDFPRKAGRIRTGSVAIREPSAASELVSNTYKLVGTRPNGLREYSTPHGSVWGWA